MSGIFIEYSSGWPCSREEKLNITEYVISYSKKCSGRIPEENLVTDLSWRFVPSALLIEETVRNISAIISTYKPDRESREVCDGDITTINLILKGEKSTWVFPLCAYEDMKLEMREALKPLLPSELPLPDFLHSYLDDIEEAEDQ